MSGTSGPQAERASSRRFDATPFVVVWYLGRGNYPGSVQPRLGERSLLQAFVRKPSFR